MKFEVFGLKLPEVEPGDDLARQLIDAAACEPGGIKAGDILVVTCKVISKSLNLLIELESVTPSARARHIAKVNGADPKVMQVVLDHSNRILLSLPILKLEDKGQSHLEDLSEDEAAARLALERTPSMLLVERNGQVYTDAGLDSSNHPAGIVSLPPEDPNQAARDLRGAICDACGIDVAVILSDTEMCLQGGTMDVARGAAGISVVAHGMGQPDRFGVPKFGGIDNVAQELAATSALVMGQTAEGIPAALIRGFSYQPSETDEIVGGLAGHEKGGSPIWTVLKHTIRTIGFRGILKAIRGR